MDFLSSSLINLQNRHVRHISGDIQQNCSKLLILYALKVRFYVKAKISEKLVLLKAYFIMLVLRSYLIKHPDEINGIINIAVFVTRPLI